ncbi:hypothetical protein P692DRAFT_20822501 [Suillus brevipes Sb2]|nr:hypothetical protein P692DRAFT_20822501 [Suillus brevipes Sb2]
MSTLAGCWLIVTSGALLGVTAAFLWTAQEDTIKLWREQLKRTWCRDSLRVLYYIKVRRRVYQAFFFDALMFRFSVRTLAEITASEITSIPRFREFCGVEDVLFAGNSSPNDLFGQCLSRLVLGAWAETTWREIVSEVREPTPRCRDNLLTPIGQRRQHLANTMVLALALPAANPPLDYPLPLPPVAINLYYGPHKIHLRLARLITLYPRLTRLFHFFGLGASNANPPSHSLPQTNDPPEPTRSLDRHGVGHADLPAQNTPSNQLQVPPDAKFDHVDLKLTLGFRQADRDHLPVHTIPHASSSSIPGDAHPLNLTEELIEQVKADAELYMVRLIFETTFFPVEAVLTRMANDALSLAVARRHNAYRWNPVDLDQWKVRAGGLQEVQRLKGTVATILKDFETVARFSVLLAYGLSLVISQRGDALTAHRIALIESLLRNEAFLDGLIHLPGIDGRIQPFVVPFAHPAIIRLVEIILLELQYHRFIFYDGSDKWKVRLTNFYAVGGALCKWLLSQYSSGFFIPTEFMTETNASYYDGLVYLIESPSWLTLRLVQHFRVLAFSRFATGFML